MRPTSVAGSTPLPSIRPYSATVVSSAAELAMIAWVMATESASSRRSDSRGLSTSAATNGRVNPGSDPTIAETALERSFLTGCDSSGWAPWPASCENGGGPPVLLLESLPEPGPRDPARGLPDRVRAATGA
jgi:hypothetical protein